MPNPLASLRSGVRKVLTLGLARRGYDIVPTEYSATTDGVLTVGLELAGRIGTVIDVGASNGSWSLALRPQLPNAKFLLFEAAPFHTEALRKIESQDLQVEYAAASDHLGGVSFLVDPDNPMGGAASAVATSEHTAVVPSTTIDHAVQSRQWPGPYLIKLDTHGHESEILRGASDVLRETSLLWIEVYGVDSPGRPSFDELCIHMRELGFRPAGIADVMKRPSDGMLWQMDMLFVPASHPVFKNTSYWK